MKKVILLFLLAAGMSCSKETGTVSENEASTGGEELGHGMIVLGEKLDNPYTTENMQKAYDSLYGSRGGRIAVPTTNLYVRFLPESEADFMKIEEAGLPLADHPLDYRIIQDGDYYQDPSIPDGQITWQYSVVDAEFKGIGVPYEIIDECCLSENIPNTRALEGTDWEAVEREAFRISGNEELLTDVTRGGSKSQPSGRITIVDKDAFGGKPSGVSGVRVQCNSFIKFSSAYTDRDGYYTIGASYSSDVRYRLVFKNESGFSIGLNLLLVPASVSTLGKESPEGLSINITEDSDEKLFRRCVVNNSAYEYFSRCTEDDLGIGQPSADTRIWIFTLLSASSAVMMHQGAVVSVDQINSFLGAYAALVKLFAPDITIGAKNHVSFRDLYCSVVHELAHASHYAQVGNDYWNKYIWYVLESFITSGGMTYGSGKGSFSGYCEVGEMWAYFMESLMYKDRYGGNMPSFGTSHWFFPQIFRGLEERGLSVSDIFTALEADVTSRDELEDRLIEYYPAKQSIIEDLFKRYCQ